MNKNLIITILVGAVSLLAGFGGGFVVKNELVKRQRTQLGARFGGNFMMGAGMGGGRRLGGMGGVTMGDIISADEKSITVKMADGSTKIVNLADSTTYSKSADSSKVDLKVGTKVAVFGSPNSDGSVTGATIQINPMFDRNIASPSPTN